MTYPIKYHHSAMQGAPALSGTAGAMIALLDAVLINGFNVLAPTSIVVASGVATVTYSTTHGYAAHDIIKVAGATPAELNGEQRVTSVTSNALTFATTAADGTATGTLETRTAPVGFWEKSFSGTNKAAYRSTDPAMTQLFLRVDDTGTNNALWRGYETMTDVDTCTGPFPTVAQAASGLFARKSSSADAVARPWVVVADNGLILFFVAWSSSYPTYAWYKFGDVLSLKEGDAYHCVIGAHTAETPSYPGASPTPAECAFTGTQCYAARSDTQIGSAVELRQGGSRASAAFGSGGQPYPSRVNNGLLLHAPVLLHEGADTAPTRGEWPGILQPIQNQPLASGDIVDNFPSLPGRRVLLLRIDSSSSEGRIAIDITGPWR